MVRWATDYANDDFLHRLRVEPNPKFLAALKTRFLDLQAVDQGKARRTLFRTAILAALIGGSAVAVAFVAWRSVPHAFNGIAQVRDVQDKRSGGGARRRRALRRRLSRNRAAASRG